MTEIPVTEIQDHVRSYYAATANDHRRYPALDGEVDVDVCVIGGGFSGVASALTLAERGFSVALLEANRIGWGATGRNGGQALPGWSGEAAMVKQLGDDAREFLVRTRHRGNEIIENWIEKYQIRCDYVRGAATVALKKSQMPGLAEEIEEAEKHGGAGHLKIVEGDDLKAYVNSDHYVGGLIDERGAHLHPLNLCAGEARAAHALGARIFEGAAVTEIEHGERPLVKTAAGAVRASYVILAGNAYHQLERKELSGYLLPAQTYQIATEPLDEATARDVLPRNTAVCDANMVLDYFRLSADRRMLFGGRCTYSNRDIVDVEGALAPRMREVFPQLKDVRIEFQWGGAIGIILNRVPMLGRTQNNVFYVQGYSGHGVNCSHIAAEILADAIASNDRDAALFERVSHFRVPGGGLVGSPLLALGMTYYRLKDAIGA